ncbi:MAG: DinB family protein [Candidatus Hydrogenedentes bacterium]|nr:DinB family protein [Candidatus Hydrogenedentota bacterium]
MNNPKMSVLIELLKQARAQTLKAAHDVPESHRFKQLQAEKATPIWLLGHLSRTMDRVILEYMLQESQVLSDEDRQRFAPSMAGGTPPTSNPEDYPAWDAVVALYETASAQAIEKLSALADTDWDKPLPGEMTPAYRELFPTIGAALQRVINHDAYHRGQIGLLSKLN